MPSIYIAMQASAIVHSCKFSKHFKRISQEILQDCCVINDLKGVTHPKGLLLSVFTIIILNLACPIDGLCNNGFSHNCSSYSFL